MNELRKSEVRIWDKVCGSSRVYGWAYSKAGVDQIYEIVQGEHMDHVVGWERVEKP